ncbi:MAG: N-acetylmuramidase family protein [Bacteroides sp.]|nr:N-acetylmuramidase family protein [Bacteroides sp.]MCM1379902.1 N-acetylmuramidase family protein [Bacteroides sp.]MCM1446244.1 N-acetylmuramidase family protein [Prevotella sp.]
MSALLLIVFSIVQASSPVPPEGGLSETHKVPHFRGEQWGLTLPDYEKVAKELDIPVAAIRAVVEIEAGPRAEGFNPDYTPIINFDITMFRQAARRRGININVYRKSHPVVFAPLNRRRFGSTQAAQYARLDSAMTIDTVAAIEGTFWGMFQIGGFNWKLCGCCSAREFANMMCESEFDQLELFARFIKARGLDKYIRARDWAGFALRYNGPGYKRMRYDTRMAAAFARFSR